MPLSMLGVEEKSQAGRPGFFLIRADLAGAYPANQRENCECDSRHREQHGQDGHTSPSTGGRQIVLIFNEGITQIVAEDRHLNNWRRISI